VLLICDCLLQVLSCRLIWKVFLRDIDIIIVFMIFIVLVSQVKVIISQILKSDKEHVRAVGEHLHFDGSCKMNGHTDLL